MDPHLKFLARSESILEHATERTEWKCNHCPRVRDSRMAMLQHLLDNHPEKIDVESKERRVRDAVE